MSRTAALLMAVTVVLTSVAAPAGAAATQEGSASAYSGAHVSFDTKANAVANYAVDGETMFESVKVQSESKAKSSGMVSVGASLSAVTNIQGSAISLASKTNAQASIQTGGSAKMSAHDNGHGILVVNSSGNSQYVVANLSSGSEAKQESESQVSVTTESGTKGTFIVVGEGSVTVNENGNVSANLGENGKLIFRSYPDGKDDNDEKQEDLIAQGTAAAEVHVMQQSGETVTDVATYGQQTSVKAKQSAENTVKVTADRAKSQGKVIITSVSEATIGTVENVQVKVDGEAAAKASSYSELKGAIGGDQSKYMVRQESSASAKADVLVAVNHFSERTMTVSGSQAQSGETTTTTQDGGDSGGGSGDSTGSKTPGFGVGVALVSLVAAALLARLE